MPGLRPDLCNASFIRACHAGTDSSALCRLFGISRKTGYKMASFLTL